MKKYNSFFFSFLPFLAALSLQFFLVFPIAGVRLLGACLSHIISGTKTSLFLLMNELSAFFSSQNFSEIYSNVFALCGIVVFGFWYAKQFHGFAEPSVSKTAPAKLLLEIACLVPLLQILTSLITGFVASLFPQWLAEYQKLMNLAGFDNSPSLLLILYAVFFGPIEEELVFRGVTLSSAKRALPFWAANLMQAVLFGIFHMNMIQGIYAFCIALFFGYVCEKSGSIFFSIFLHILFNAWGTFVPTYNLLPSEPFSYGLYCLAAVLLGIFSFSLFRRDTSE